uniref:Uncharacterized protein n=1 Tax=viral metagenome TaxID=1070528 RepID=A0A6M3LIS7_9ZZZZ
MIRLRVDWINEYKWCHIRRGISGGDLTDGFDEKEQHWTVWEDCHGWNAVRSSP